LSSDDYKLPPCRSDFRLGEELAAILDSHPRWTADVFNKFLQRLKRSRALQSWPEQSK
jgi:hypothetical protein